MSHDKIQIRVVSAEIRVDDKYLITQRPKNAVLPLLWEFPGGRVRDGESDAACLERVAEGRIGVGVTTGEMLFEVTHSYDAYDIVLAVYACSLVGGTPRAVSVAQIAWVSPDQFSDYTFPGADQKTVELLLKEN
jgi:8-oxo-dGTP diphosphatase